MVSPYSYRHDPTVPPFPDDRPIIVFDGHCVLCSGFARFMLRRDRAGRYRLLPAQTLLGDALYRHYGLDPDDYQTNILVEDGGAYFRSEGSIRMFEGLGWPWRAATVLRVLPTRWRDALYDLVARNRLKWFGRSDVCYLADPDMKDRFLS